MASRTPLGVIDLHDGLCPTENCEAWLGEHRFKIFQHHIITGWYLERYVNSFESLCVLEEMGRYDNSNTCLTNGFFPPSQDVKGAEPTWMDRSSSSKLGMECISYQQDFSKVLLNFPEFVDFVRSFSDFLLEFFVCFSESNWFLHVVSPFKMVLNVWKAIYCNYEETGTNSGSWPSAHSARRVKLLGAGNASAMNPKGHTFASSVRLAWKIPNGDPAMLHCMLHCTIK